jgi:hypothetical protein
MFSVCWGTSSDVVLLQNMIAIDYICANNGLQIHFVISLYGDSFQRREKDV